MYVYVLGEGEGEGEGEGKYLHVKNKFRFATTCIYLPTCRYMYLVMIRSVTPPF